MRRLAALLGLVLIAWGSVARSAPIPRFAERSAPGGHGVSYHGARWRLAVGRFASVDPASITRAELGDPQRLHRYAALRTNPLRYTDPDGREIQTVADAIAQTERFRHWKAEVYFGKRFLAQLQKAGVSPPALVHQWESPIPWWEGASAKTLALAAANPEAIVPGAAPVGLPETEIPVLRAFLETKRFTLWVGVPAGDLLLTQMGRENVVEYSTRRVIIGRGVGDAPTGLQRAMVVEVLIAVQEAIGGRQAALPYVSWTATENLIAGGTLELWAEGELPLTTEELDWTLSDYGRTLRCLGVFRNAQP